MTITAMPQSATAAKSKGGSPTLIIALIIVAAIVCAGALLIPKHAGKPAAPKPGPVVKLDSIQLNLADGHYLRLGMALQTREGAKEIDGSKALNAAIDLFSGQATSDLDQGRNALKTKLNHELADLYDGDVLSVYFTEFVTQ